MGSFVDYIKKIWGTEDLRKDIGFVFLILIIYRIAAHVPVPGINIEGLRAFFNANQFFGLLNIFSGGGLANFSVIMLGVGPYITSSIIVQLLTMVVPSLEELSKEGESGMRKINQYTRYLTVPIAVIQAYGFISLLQNQSRLIQNFSFQQWLFVIVVVTAGSMFLTWLGELISDKRVGNGVSLLIFAGIVAGLPTGLQRTAAVFTVTEILSLVAFAVVALLTVVAIVIMNDAQRAIPVSYARTGRLGGSVTHLPLRLLQAGVIPIIFAISILVFPNMIAQFLSSASSEMVREAAKWVTTILQNQIVYAGIYFVLVVAFTYFYTAVVFHPDKIADNLQKQGGFVPGIRPGIATADNLRKVMNRVTGAGAVFLGIIAILPLVIQPLTGITTLAIGGTSILIVVSVVIDSVKKIQAQLVMRDYDVL
ncbi:MAG: preprotein translocase subunit SecY [bacterium]